VNLFVLCKWVWLIFMLSLYLFFGLLILIVDNLLLWEINIIIID